MHRIILGLIVGIILISQPAYAYIDPATGSMLFSVFLGVITTLFFLVQVLWMKIRTLFSDKSLSKNNNKFVIYSEGKKYDSLFLPILDEFEKRKVPVVFYTSSTDDLAFDKKYEFIDCQYIGQGNKAFLKLAFINADVCLMTTPNLDVFQLKRSKNVKYYCHVAHGICDSCRCRLYALDYYDAVLLCTENNEKYIREIEQKRDLKPKEIITVGSPQLDYMTQHIKEMPADAKKKFTVLFAPSWGEISVLSRFGDTILNQLSAKKDWNIIFRPHPQSYENDNEKEKLSYLFDKYKDAENIIVDKSPDNIPSMAQADIMISDFSSINFEFAFLFNKPIIYSMQDVNLEIYDISTLEKNTWKEEAIRKIGTELTSDNVGDLINVVENAGKSANIQEVKDFAWQKQGEGAKNTVDFLITKQMELNRNGRNSL